MNIPRLISVDDHVIEPAHVWVEHLPARHRQAGPALVRRRGRATFAGRSWVLLEDEGAPWADCWSYDGQLFSIDRTGLNEEETMGLLRGNAIECYGLDRYGLVA